MKRQLLFYVRAAHRHSPPRIGVHASALVFASVYWLSTLIIPQIGYQFPVPDQPDNIIPFKHGI